MHTSSHSVGARPCNISSTYMHTSRHSSIHHFFKFHSLSARAQAVIVGPLWAGRAVAASKSSRAACGETSEAVKGGLVAAAGFALIAVAVLELSVCALDIAVITRHACSAHVKRE